MDAAFKAFVHLGAVVFLGGGVFARWIGADALDHRVLPRLRLLVIIGGLMLSVGSVLDAYRAIGTVSLSEFWEYLTLSRHGQFVLGRLVMVAALLLAALPAERSTRTGKVVYGALGVMVLGTISFVSHTGAHGGPLGVLVDLVHQIAGVVWAGSLLYFAALPIWPPEGNLPPASLVTALRRISNVGLISVIAIVASGIFAAFVHLPTLSALAGTSYGQTLIVKLVLFGGIMAVAAANRFVFLPQVVLPGATRGMARMVRIESLLLLAIFLVTGSLSSQAPPHQ